MKLKFKLLKNLFSVTFYCEYPQACLLGIQISYDNFNKMFVEDITISWGIFHIISIFGRSYTKIMLLKKIKDVSLKYLCDITDNFEGQ